MERFVVLEKAVGETPLECAETWRAAQTDEYQSVPLAYAGRLDPMASGKLLVLIGDECKRQEQYHGLDKEYEFQVLFGVSSDSGDVLGIVSPAPPAKQATFHEPELTKVCRSLVGQIELPYPAFSAKTVQGKPLHTWTLEGRLNEIKIPTASTTVYSLKLLKLESLSIEVVYRYATEKIETIPPVTDSRKAIGNDFRRPEVRAVWQTFLQTHTQDTYQVATFRCRCSTGTYMRSLAEKIAAELGTAGLAYSIHRTNIGWYYYLTPNIGWWTKRYS